MLVSPSFTTAESVAVSFNQKTQYDGIWHGSFSHLNAGAGARSPLAQWLQGPVGGSVALLQRLPAASRWPLLGPFCWLISFSNVLRGLWCIVCRLLALRTTLRGDERIGRLLRTYTCSLRETPRRFFFFFWTALTTLLTVKLWHFI